MTAADKLRELLATRPAVPSLEELTRWWATSAELVPKVLGAEAEELRRGIERILATGCGRTDRLYADLRHLLDSTDAREWTSLKAIVDVLAAADRRHAEDRAQVDSLKQEVRELEQQRDAARTELDRIKPSAEVLEQGMWRPCTGCHESDEGHPLGPYSETLRCNVGDGCHECGGIGSTWEPGHPTSWLDCPDCRARSKSGAEPPRCEAFVAEQESARG